VTDYDYIPNIVSPVWYGSQDFNLPSPLDAAFRVLYPALLPLVGTPEDPTGNPPLYVGLSKYKVVTFVHGQETTYKSWDFVLSELARAGYIVVIPEGHGEAVAEDPAAVDIPIASFEFVVASPQSPFRDVIDISQSGFCGHSYGATTAASIAINHGPSSVYASIAGAFNEFFTNQGSVDLTSMTMPKLFIVGGNAAVDPVGAGFDLVSGDPVDRNLWDLLPRPKHNLNFLHASHFDYLPPDAPGVVVPFRGPCPLVPRLTADFLVSFFSKYMPPLLDDSMGVKNNLVVAPAGQIFVKSYPAGFLTGLGQINLNLSCHVVSAWELPPVPPAVAPVVGSEIFGLI
jgi:Chlorophyllase enzyme